MSRQPCTLISRRKIWGEKADWSGKWDSNPQPSPWEGDTLPLSYSRSRSKDKILCSPLDVNTLCCKWSGYFRILGYRLDSSRVPTPAFWSAERAPGHSTGCLTCPILSIIVFSAVNPIIGFSRQCWRPSANYTLKLPHLNNL